MLASAANTHDSRLFEPMLETNPSVRRRRGRPGRPRRRPEKLHADKGYDYPRCRRYLHRRGIKIRIARRRIGAKTHLGRHRWMVERTISWVLRYKCLGLRYDRTEATLLPLRLLAVTLISFRRLRQDERRDLRTTGPSKCPPGNPYCNTVRVEQSMLVPRLELSR